MSSAERIPLSDTATTPSGMCGPSLRADIQRDLEGPQVPVVDTYQRCVRRPRHAPAPVGVVDLDQRFHAEPFRFYFQTFRDAESSSAAISSTASAPAWRAFKI